MRVAVLRRPVPTAITLDFHFVPTVSDYASVPLENNLFLLSSETLDAVVLLRYPHCSPVRPRSVLTPGAWAHTSSRMAIPQPKRLGERRKYIAKSSTAWNGRDCNGGIGEAGEVFPCVWPLLIL